MFTHTRLNRALLTTFSTLLVSLSYTTPALSAETASVGSVSQIAIDLQSDTSTIPSVAAAIANTNSTLWSGTSHCVDANRNNGLSCPNTQYDINDQFRIGSETKTFTATVILQLIDNNTISLSDTLDSFNLGLNIPNSDKITVKDLLQMTSTIPDYLASPATTGSGTIIDQWTRDLGQTQLTPQQLVAQSNQSDRTSNMSYSNTNFVLLGLIAQQALCNNDGSCSIENEINTRIFQQLGMNNSLFPSNDQFTSSHAQGYVLVVDGAPITGAASLESDQANSYLNSFTHVNPDVPWSAGAIVSNVNDQIKWIKQLASNSDNLLSSSLQNTRINDTVSGAVAGLPAQYGLGIYTFQNGLNGNTLIGHSGAIFGFTSSIFYNPKLDLYYVVNVNQFPATQSAVNYLWELDRQVTLAMEADGNCSDSSTTSTNRCTGASVRTKTLTIDNNSLSIAASGKTYTGYDYKTCQTNSDGTVSCSAVTHVVPALAIYGHNTNGIEIKNGGRLTVEASALYEMHGRNSNAIFSNGNSSITIAGTVKSFGVNSNAIAGNGSNDHIIIEGSGRVEGNIDLGAGNNRLVVNGVTTGSIQGSNTRISGAGLIQTLNLGSGTLEPGNSIGTININTLQLENASTIKLEVNNRAHDSITANQLLIQGGKLLIENQNIIDDQIIKPITANNVQGNALSLSTNSRLSLAQRQHNQGIDIAISSPVHHDAQLLSLQRQHTQISQLLLNKANRQAASSQQLNNVSSPATLWLSALGRQYDWENTEGIADFESQSNGIVLGIEATSDKQLGIGLYSSHMSGDYDVKAGRSRGDTNTTSVGAYLHKIINSHYYHGQFNYHAQKTEINRHINTSNGNQTAKSDQDLNAYAMSIAWGLKHSLGKAWELNPEVSSHYSIYRFDDSKEYNTDSFNLSHNANSFDDISLNINTRFNHQLKLDGNESLQSHFIIGLSHIEALQDRKRQARYENFGNETFDIHIYDDAQTLIKLGLGLEWKNDTFHLGVATESTMSDELSSYSASLNFGKQF